MNELPTPPRTPRPGGIRLTPALFGGAMAVLVLMVFTIVFLLTEEKPPPSKPVAAPTTAPSVPPSASEPPGTQPPASEPVPTGEGKFSKDVEPCDLVTEELLTKLVVFPRQNKIYKEECEWRTQPEQGAGLPENMSFKVTVYAKVFPNGPAQAHEQFVARRYEASLISQGYTKAEPAIGDDSYVSAYTLPLGNGRGPTTAIAGTRVSNALVEVKYDRWVPEDPEGRLTAGALELARAVAESLANGVG